MADRDFVVKNGLVVNTTFTANSTRLSLGSNVVVNNSSYYVGNSTANAVLTSTSLSVSNSSGIANLEPTRIIVGNSVVNSTVISIGNVVVNTTIISIGNSTVNSIINSTSFSGTAAAALTIAGASATNIVNTSGDYTITGVHTHNANTIFNANIQVTGVVANGSRGTAGQLLTSNGTSTYWSTVTISASVAGGDTQIQFNDSGSLNATAGFTFNKTSNTISVGNSTVNSLINSTSFSGTANNALFLGGTAAVGYQTTAGLSANVATLSSNNASFLGGVAAASYVNTSGSYTIGGVLTFSANAIFNANIQVTGVVANGSRGTAGQLLTSNGTTAYWSTPPAAVAGADLQIQFNDGGFLNAAAGFTFSKTTNNVFISGNLGVGNTSPNAKLQVTGTANISGNVAIDDNLSLLNAKRITFAPVAGGSNVYFTLQNDDNFVFYSTNTLNEPRAVWGIFANSATSNLQAYVPLQLNSSLVANSTTGTNGQVLTSNGSGVYWSTAGGGATLTANNTDPQTFYLPMANATSGSWTNGVISTTKLYFVPSTGTLNATIFNSLSDARYKSNVATIENALETVCKLRGVTFDWKDNGNKSAGIIAQEAQDIVPMLVGNNEIKNVNYDGLVGFLIEAIKELNAKIEKLENG